MTAYGGWVEDKGTALLPPAWLYAMRITTPLLAIPKFVFRATSAHQSPSIEVRLGSAGVSLAALLICWPNRLVIRRYSIFVFNICTA